MASYRFTERAEQDLEQIIDYTFAQWSGPQAGQYIDGLGERSQILADNPDLGVRRDEISQGLLGFPYQSHILYYFKQPQGITVVRVLHGRMDPKRHI